MEKFTLKEIPLPANLTAADLSSSSRKVKLKRVRLLEEQAAESARIGDAPSENYPTKPELPMRKDAQKDSVQDQNEIESIGDTIKRRIKSELKAAASSPNSTDGGDKARSDIVDEMFRDFLAQKMELVEKEYVKKRKLDTSKNEQNQKESSSVDDNQEPDDKDERDEKVKEKKHKKKKHKHEKHKKRDKHEKSKHAKRSKRSRSRSKSTEKKEDSMSKDLESSVPLSKEGSLSTRSTQSGKQDPKFSPRKEDSKSMSPPRKKHSKRRRSRSKSPERKEDSLSKDLKPRTPLSKEESLSTRSTQKIEVDSKSMSPPRRKHSKRSRSRSKSHERKEDSMSKDLKPRAPLSKEESLSTRSAQGVEKDSKSKATSHRKHSKRSKSGSKSPERKEDSMSKVLKSSVALSKEESLSTRSTPSIVEDSKFSSRSRKSKSKSPPRRKKDSKSISPLKFEEDATEIKSVSPPAPKLISKFRLSHDKVDDIESKLQHMKGDPVRSWPFSHKKESSPDTNKIIDKPFSKSKANEQNETDTQNSSNLKATASNSDSDKRLTVKQNKPPDSNSEVRVHVVTSALQRLTDADVCHSTPSTSTIPPTSIPLPVEPPTTKAPSVATVTSGNKAMPVGLLAKKPGIALKISSASANLISSGEVVPPPNKKKKLLEEGEVTSSDTDESSDDSDTGEDDDDVSKLNDDGFPSETGSITDSDDDKSGKAKKKKKKKHKHKGLKRKKKKKKNKKKSSNSRSRSVSPMGPRSPSPSRRRDRSTSRGRNRDRSTSRDRHRDRSDSRDRYRDRSRSRDRFREEPSIRVEKQWIAEKGKPLKLFTRTYRETHGMDDRKRSRSRSPDRDRSRGKERDKRSPDSRRNRSRERGQRRDSSRDRDKGGKGREKDRKDREKDLQIDKAKLRKIAIANAVHIMKSRGGSQAAISSDALAKLRAGGKSVEELTDYCKKLSDRDKQRQLERSLRADDSLSDSSEDYEHAAKSEEEDFTIHHPFAVKEAPNIVMNIRNMKQLPILTPQEKVTEGAKLRLTFPVSSGSQHRAKESEWVPVEKSTAPPAVTTTVNTTAVSTPSPIPPDASSRSAPVAPATITTAADVAKEVATVAVPEKDKVFPDPPKMPIDIGSIVSERLAAVRRLQANPNDVQAISQMRTAQKKASLWAESKVLPGQFMGSTGATIMSQQELIGPDKKRQAWARKEQLSTAAPLAGGIGMMMLQKLGWKHGEGLGKNSDGPQTPLMLDVKIDRKGLTSQDEVQRKVPAPRAQRTTVKDLSGKHPVSALVEVCNKRKWGTPDFILVEESGPPHKKNFIFKVAVNGVEYQSAVASNNKKQAKAQAATGCLQELGLVPR